MRPASTTRSGWSALGFAHPDLSAFAYELGAMVPAGDADSWAIGDVTRDRAKQTAEKAAGRSALAFPLSAHNWESEGDDDPGGSFAIDMWPVKNGSVIGDSSHPAYSQLATLAAARGLKTGASWGDFGHIEIRNYRSLLPSTPHPGGALVTLLVGALLWWMK